MTNTDQLRKAIFDRGNIPVHIAMVMDGNGRWAKKRFLPRIAGHREGINSVREVTRICGEIGIKHLTLYTFSKENWNRPRKEVSAIMQLLLSTIRAEVKNLHKNNVRLSVIGQINDLTADARQGMLEGVELTRNNTGLNLNLALSYGSRQEITTALRTLIDKVLAGELEPDAIDEKMISKHLYTSQMPDPDLLIRTGGDFRISNFLLWQMAYTEVFVTPVFWPDFRERELLEAIGEYQKRERRFGMVSEQIK
ncbi:MAG: isoprenyl transferase [Candidatus Marinimicrobia bacterium]|nr:isoprenyl transferase [Candidatus Neomarinimicrobiota bacterium]